MAAPAKPAKVRTRDKILKTSLALFNSESEAQVSTVDIAAVLGISPGNLYYHFKGKEAIIEALFGEFETELRLVLSAPIEKPLSLEDNWIFIYIVFEEINDFRFFYEGMSSILERCPSLRARVARLDQQRRDGRVDEPRVEFHGALDGGLVHQSALGAVALAQLQADEHQRADDGHGGQDLAQEIDFFEIHRRPLAKAARQGCCAASPS